jgi:hypothetical protein
MIRLCLLILVFALATWSIIAAENLGEVAKKEKARREAIEKKGKKAKVFTNADVDKLKAQIAIQKGGGQAPAEGTAEQPPANPEPAAPAVETSPEVQPVTEPEPVVQTDEKKPVEEQIKDLQEQKEQLEKEAQAARDAIGAGGIYHSRNVGVSAEKEDEAEKKLEEVNKKLEELEKKTQEQHQ